MRRYEDNNFPRYAQRRSKLTNKKCELNILNQAFNSHLPLFSFPATLLQSLSSSDVEFSHNHDYFLLHFKKKAFDPFFFLHQYNFQGKKADFQWTKLAYKFYNLHIPKKQIDFLLLFDMNFKWTDTRRTTFVKLNLNKTASIGWKILMIAYRKILLLNRAVKHLFIIISSLCFHSFEFAQNGNFTSN